MADALLGLDEGAADVVIADEPAIVRQPGLLREPERGSHPGVRHRDDQVRGHRVFPGQLVAERLAHGVHVAAPQHRVRPREVDVLEQTALVDDQDLARLDVALRLRFHEVERAGLGGEHPGVPEAAQGERPEAGRVAHPDHAVGGQQQQGVGAPHAGERSGELVGQRRPLGPRDEVQDHLGVGRRLEDRAVLLELLPQRLRVHEIAVVGDGHRAVRGGAGDGLGVAQVRAARGGVADVADRAMAGQALEPLAIEDVRHPAHRLLDLEVVPIGRGDPGRLLSAVLQRVEPEVGDVGGLGVVPDAEEAALVVELVVQVECRRLS